MKQSIGMVHTMFPKLLFNSGESFLWKWGHRAAHHNFFFYLSFFVSLSSSFSWSVGVITIGKVVWKRKASAGFREEGKGGRETDDVRTSLSLYLPLAKRAPFFWRPGSPELPITAVREHRPDGGKGRLILFYSSSLRALSSSIVKKIQRSISIEKDGLSDALLPIHLQRWQDFSVLLSFFLDLNRFFFFFLLVSFPTTLQKHMERKRIKCRP